MEKSFTVHITHWLGGLNFYITENKSGKHVGVLFGTLRKKVIALLQGQEPQKEAFDFVAQGDAEPNPIPVFVDHYELRYYKPAIVCVPFLTEKGKLRKTFEETHSRRRITPFGPMYF